ncbi:SMN complex subunit Gem8 [Schizosaccharomyces osmophilus]|uniref:SMN complex subunit Gem8 n=1 Tax=Schizosaccharomyces osmophilus TaxID=2545709 RepID=A0AAE9W9B2_9SCHI|nr:SMN complex subunit Gem8 [Schizosaccharomyces osmophilus]WBW72059.1 SMN complex subunit Gem8 [Schizosaccharomyces osmophilus]
MSLTEEDLRKFHDEHFGNVAIQCWENAFLQSPADLDVSSTYNKNSKLPSIERYPDGTIRTLTDEQISYFRESEVRELKWKREKEQFMQEKEKATKAFEQTSVAASVPESEPHVPMPLQQSLSLDSYQTLYGYSCHDILELEQILDNSFQKFTAVATKYWPPIPIRS